MCRACFDCNRLFLNRKTNYYWISKGYYLLINKLLVFLSNKPWLFGKILYQRKKYKACTLPDQIEIIVARSNLESNKLSSPWEL